VAICGRPSSASTGERFRWSSTVERWRSNCSARSLRGYPIFVGASSAITRWVSSAGKVAWFEFSPSGTTMGHFQEFPEAFSLVSVVQVTAHYLPACDTASSRSSNPTMSTMRPSRTVRTCSEGPLHHGPRRRCPRTVRLTRSRSSRMLNVGDLGSDPRLATALVPGENLSRLRQLGRRAPGAPRSRRGRGAH